MLHGIVKDATASAYTFLFGIFASTGVPLTAGFIADVLIFIGTIHTFGLVGAVPLLSIILLGAYMYYAVNRSFLSTTTVSKARWHTGSAQLASYAVLITGILVFGVFPFLILSAVSI
jgi:NADH:ubiquinone oxidoreductase subunit 4 (subunit M)